MPSTSEAWLECSSCSTVYPIGPRFFGCTACRERGRIAALVMRYSTTAERLRDASRPGIWRWRGLLPPVPEDQIVSLSEGSTPLRRIRNWESPAELYLKNETMNPTWSYKDRAASVSATMARFLGFSRTTAISTGNLGNSVAAYSSAAGLACTIFCNPGAPELQLALMQRYGARVFRGGDQNALVRQLVTRGGWFPATVVCPRDGFANPFGVEGFKTIAFEIFEQLGDRVPDRVFAPAGSGDGLFGIWKGFDELYRLGIAKSVPKMIACQASGADVYVRAVRSGASKLTALPSVSTVALSIAEKIGGEMTLGALYGTHGDAIAVSDEQMMSAAADLGREGFALEPASAASVACARTVAAEAAAGEVWVAIGTGAAVKWPDDLTRGFAMPDALPDDFDRIDDLIKA